MGKVKYNKSSPFNLELVFNNKEANEFWKEVIKGDWISCHPQDVIKLVNFIEFGGKLD